MPRCWARYETNLSFRVGGKIVARNVEVGSSARAGAVLARLEQAQAQLSVSKNQAGYTELVADHAGVVTAILAEVGQVVTAGQTVMKLARTDVQPAGSAKPTSRRSPESGFR